MQRTTYKTSLLDTLLAVHRFTWLYFVIHVYITLVSCAKNRFLRNKTELQLKSGKDKSDFLLAKNIERNTFQNKIQSIEL